MRIEGYDAQEILELSDEHLEMLILNGEPLVFRAGTADILGQFQVIGLRLIIELAQIDGGGEGVLPTIASLAGKYAKRKHLQEIEWLVYATNCAKPNLRLRAMLERKDFMIRNVEGKGDCYHKVVSVKG